MGQTLKAFISGGLPMTYKVHKSWAPDDMGLDNTSQCRN